MQNEKLQIVRNETIYVVNFFSISLTLDKCLNNIGEVRNGEVKRLSFISATEMYPSILTG